jgi:hypothetical protein
MKTERMDTLAILSFNDKQVTLTYSKLAQTFVVHRYSETRGQLLLSPYHSSRILSFTVMTEAVKRSCCFTPKQSLWALKRKVFTFNN